MATKRRQPGPPRDPDDLDEGPSEADLEQFGGVTRPCPECKTELYDDAAVCWKCGHALSSEPKGLPVWVMVTAAVVLIGFLFVMFR